MLPDADRFAEMVALCIKAALAPLQAQQEALRAEVAGLRERMSDTSLEVKASALLERVVALETKAAQSLPTLDLGDLSDRVVALETKAAGPSAPEVVLAVTQDVGLIRERLGVLETKAAAPAPPASSPDEALIDLRARLASLETKAHSDTTSHEMAGLRERIAVLETRAPVPGPAGADGRDGKDGKDGLDGLGFEDMEPVYDEAGRLSLKFSRGERVKEARVHGFVDRGTYKAGETYEQGDGVSYGGGFWIARKSTDTKPDEAGDGARAWRLAVKKGRDGRDARPYTAPTSLPVVSSGGGHG